MTTGDLADVIGRWEGNPTLPSAVCNPISWRLCSLGCDVSSEERQHTHQALEPMVGLSLISVFLPVGAPQGQQRTQGTLHPNDRLKGMCVVSCRQHSVPVA